MSIADLVLGIVLTFISIFVLMYSRRFPHFIVRGVRLPGPSFFPRILAILLLLFAAYFVSRYLLFRKKPNPEGTYKSDLKSLLNIVWTSLSVVLFFPLANLVGALLALVIICFLLMIILKSKWYEAAIFSVVMTLIIHLVFHVVFKIPLPEGILFARLR